MALKSFFVDGEFSGRSTRLSGGPRVSAKDSWMNFDVFQRVNGDPEKIVEISSIQKGRTLKTTVKVIPPDGSDIVETTIETRY